LNSFSKTLFLNPAVSQMPIYLRLWIFQNRQ